MPSARRSDYKGERRRLGLRISEELWMQLRVLLFATGQEKNDFIEQTVQARIEGVLRELEEQHGPTKWQSIVECAKAQTKRRR